MSSAMGWDQHRSGILPEDPNGSLCDSRERRVGGFPQNTSESPWPYSLDVTSALRGVALPAPAPFGTGNTE